MNFQLKIIYLTIIILAIKIVQPKTSCHVSVWDAFCREKVFYEPYINIWQGGKSKVLLRSRGPGYIDVSSLSDIYICTNGLVMYYYAKTKDMGHLLEAGELKWIPHHCALYNPSCGTGGMKPIRRLLAILLIGHPKDYRNPALQIFMSPYYDRGWEYPPRQGIGYINLTSLLMVGRQGECIVEKGHGGESILRIQANSPDFPTPAAEGSETEGKEIKEKPPTFCRLDASKYLGESDDYDPIAVMSQVDQNPMDRQEARTTTAGNDKPGIMFALQTDEPIKFKGCLPYPMFNMKQHDIIVEQVEKYSDPTHEKFISLELIDEFSPNIDNAPEVKAAFWNTKIRGKLRYERTEYNIKEESVTPDRYQALYDEAKKTWETKLDAYKEKIKEKATIEEIEAAEEEEFVAYTEYYIYPYIQEYRKLRDYTMAQLENNVKLKWNLTKEAMDNLNITGTYQEYTDTLKKISQLNQAILLNPYDLEASVNAVEARKELVKIEKKLRKESIELARHITIAEVLTTNYWRHRTLLTKMKERFQTIVRNLEKRKIPPPYKLEPWPLKDMIISMVNLRKDNTILDHRICDFLPWPEDTCKRVKPASEDAGALYKASIGKGPDWEVPDDKWRDRVFSLIENIFTTTCPYLPDTYGFVRSINRIIKGYLLHFPFPPYVQHYHETEWDSNYTKMDSNHTYLSHIYNETILLSPNLTAMRPLWEPLLDALEFCSNKVTPLEFYAESGHGPGSTGEILFRKQHINNNTFEDFPSSEIFMHEQAEREFTFNWAIDMHWKIFSTVLGTCMEYYYEKTPLVNAHLYSMYNEDFLFPLRQVWMSTHHNPVFRTIFGKVYANGKAEKWVNICMESSFIKSGDVYYRPLRWLLVNSFSELNFFTSGPMSGTSGVYFK